MNTYWGDVWLRLRKNHSAIIALVILALLFVFCTLGPWLWTMDPSAQDITQISQPPSLQQTSLVVTPWSPWVGVHADTPTTSDTTLAAPRQIKTIGTPHTEFVRLTWNPVSGAERYRVYRHEAKPTGIHDLGIPLGTTTMTNEVSFEDRLALEHRRYFYSVQAMYNGTLSPQYTTIAVDVQHATVVQEGTETGTTIQLQHHPLGTDYLGRDILVRIMYGGRTSLFVGIVAPLCFVAIGLIYGCIAGFAGRHLDNIMMRFADFIIALPFLLFMILFKVALGAHGGGSGILPMMIALVVLSWPNTARLVRGQVLQLKNLHYVEAVKLQGASSTYIIRRHMLPAIIGILMVTLTFAIPAAIFTEAFLSFIGLGIVPPEPSWGSMCNDGIKSMLTRPHELFFPAIFISVTVLCFNVLGDGLRDALDIRMETGS